MPRSNTSKDCRAAPLAATPMHLCLALLLATTILIVGPSSAFAQRLENGVAVFAALDKVTAKIKRLEVPINQTVEFGALTVTPRVCYSRPATERPKTTTFVEINETQLDGASSKLFSGWMFAESPGLNAVEHPVFDIWLTECEKPRNLPPANTAAQAGPKGEGANPDDGTQAEPYVRRTPRRRVRR